MRYCRSPRLQPMWSSDKQTLSKDKIPQCEKCGAARIFEFQIMPQLFDYLEPLHMVDWDTICIYTCSNPNCFPEFSKN